MNIRARYDLNKAAAIGAECLCPSCGTKFTKGNYQQAFCKSKPGTKCKDKYWNTVTPEKKNNTARISPASARWMSNNMEQRQQDKEDRERIELEWDGGWDAHGAHVERCEWCRCLICQCEY